MTGKELLKEALRALNDIPNTALRGPFRNTYELAAAIDAWMAKASLPAGVEVVGLDDPAKLHNTIARAVGEDEQ